TPTARTRGPTAARSTATPRSSPRATDMRRLALIFTLLAGAVAALAATSATGDDSRTYYLEFDNAFGLVNGSEVKVAGVSAGTITDLEINSDKRAVIKVELSGPVAVLGEDTVC